MNLPDRSTANFHKPITYRMGWTRCVSHLICLKAGAVMGARRIA